MVALRETTYSTPDTWWAFSRTHGWVILDRNLPTNRCTSYPEGYLFTRCRDWKDYEQGEQPWTYKEAGRYLDSLSPVDAQAAAQELAALQQQYEEELEVIG